MFALFTNGRLSYLTDDASAAATALAAGCCQDMHSVKSLDELKEIVNGKLGCHGSDEVEAQTASTLEETFNTAAAKTIEYLESISSELDKRAEELSDSELVVGMKNQAEMVFDKAKSNVKSAFEEIRRNVNSVFEEVRRNVHEATKSGECKK